MDKFEQVWTSLNKFWQVWNVKKIKIWNGIKYTFKTLIIPWQMKIKTSFRTQIRPSIVNTFLMVIKRLENYNFCGDGFWRCVWNIVFLASNFNGTYFIIFYCIVVVFVCKRECFCMWYMWTFNLVVLNVCTFYFKVSTKYK